MRLYKTLAFVSVLLYLISCKQNNVYYTSNQKVLPWDIDKRRTIEDVVESVEVIPLEANIDGFFSFVNAIKVDSSGIYVSDRRKQILLAFDHEGRFRCKFGKIGNAEHYGEYKNYRAYCIDDRYLYMIDNAVMKLFTFDKYNGNFIRVQDMPFHAYDMEKLPDDKFAFVWTRHLKDNVEQDSTVRKITITNSNMEVQEAYLQPSINDGYEEKSVYLTKIDDKYSYHYFFTDTILLIDRNNFNNQEQYILPVKNTIPNDKKIDNDIFDERRVMDGHNFLNGHISPIITDKYIVFALHGNDNYGTFVYDLESRKYLFNKESDAKNYMFEPMCFHDGYIYSCVARYAYNQALEKGFAPSNSVDNVLQANEEIEYMLVKYKLK